MLATEPVSLWYRIGAKAIFIKKRSNSPGGLEVVAEHCHSREGGNLSQCGNDAKEIFKK
jgi:hypothetical protein